MVAWNCSREDLYYRQHRRSLARATLLDDCLLPTYLGQLHKLPASFLLFRPHPHVHSTIHWPRDNAKKQKIEDITEDRTTRKSSRNRVAQRKFTRCLVKRKQYSRQAGGNQRRILR